MLNGLNILMSHGLSGYLILFTGFMCIMLTLERFYYLYIKMSFNSKSELILAYREKAESLRPHVVKALIAGALDTKINVSKLSVKTLLVVGREDLLTPVFIHEKMLSKISNAQLAVVDGGHASVLERPNIMEKTILPWLLELVR